MVWTLPKIENSEKKKEIDRNVRHAADQHQKNQLQYCLHSSVTHCTNDSLSPPDPLHTQLKKKDIEQNDVQWLTKYHNVTKHIHHVFILCNKHAVVEGTRERVENHELRMLK